MKFRLCTVFEQNRLDHACHAVFDVGGYLREIMSEAVLRKIL